MRKRDVEERREGNGKEEETEGKRMLMQNKKINRKKSNKHKMLIGGYTFCGFRHGQGTTTAHATRKIRKIKTEIY